ncbi:MAG: hypothetical protein NTW29_10555 [Bacteroidetes bacterium]|nr:hypothetical protein [Bacteroidota bacterium]
MSKWFIIYKEFSDLLLKYYKADPAKAGSSLFEACSKDSVFLKYNSWLAKTLEISKTRSLDPVHVFTSFNRSRQPETDRIAIIKRWFYILDTGKDINEIDFAGCPTPFSLKLLSARPADAQQEIWRTFAEVKKEGQNGITEMVFRNIKLWYGIEVPSLTIFLFWIDPDNFLPLDKNSEKLLYKAGIIKSPPKSSYQYVGLLPVKDSQLYRDIARFGYELNADDQTKSKREGIDEFINALRRIYQKARRKVTAGGDLPFKIVAIRPIKGTNKEKYSKIIKLDTLYCFYKEYEFRKDGRIRIKPLLQTNLYNINSLSVSISAVAGKNGSGKSTLTELFYLAINNMAAKLLNQPESELIFVRGLNMDIFYTAGTFNRLRLWGRKISITEYKQKGDILKESVSRIATRGDLDEFFYTIAVNYSHYGLNALDLGEWISKLFHKNDGYQTPLVINPFRKEGNIDINNENELVKNRLFANIVQPVEKGDLNNLRVLTDNGKEVVKVRLTKHVVKIKKLREENLLGVDGVFQIFLDYFKLSIAGVSQEYIELSKLYITSKLKKICETYQSYSPFLDKDGDYFSFRDLPGLLNKIQSDSSHITYKIKQVINFFRFKTYKWYILNKDISIDKISALIEETISEASRTSQIRSVELLPPAFYNTSFLLNKGGSFQKLSSGEKQRIYTVSSIVYHLNNLDSVVGDYALSSYQYVNILFDEIELYFHPEMQRQFINYFVEYLKRVPLDNIKSLNFCFITHSPFILSDIPCQNILFLNDDGKPDETLNSYKTFGGNIHDLLANNFFLNKGYMGVYADRVITSLINFLLPEKRKKKISDLPIKWTQELARNVIDCIGEPLIKNGLDELYLVKFRVVDIDREIKRLQKLKKDLR